MFKIPDEDIVSIVQKSFEKELKERGLLTEREMDPAYEDGGAKAQTGAAFKLLINEKLWGRSRDSTIEGRLLKAVASKLEGESALAKFLDLNNYIERESATNGDGCSFDQIFARITILNTISCLINEFESGAGGQILEGLVAGVIGGTQVPTVGGQQGDLVDVETDRTYYSVKLQSPNTQKRGIKGSFDLLYQALSKQQIPINYIVFIKSSGSTIQMFEFTINLENISNFMTSANAEDLDLYFTLRDEGFGDSEARAQVSSRKGRSMGSQFYIRPTQYVPLSTNGVININIQEILDSAKGNLKILTQDAENLLTSVNNMIEQINGFLLAEVDSDNAQASADVVKNKIDEFASRQQTACK